MIYEVPCSLQIVYKTFIGRPIEYDALQIDRPSGEQYYGPLRLNYERQLSDYDTRIAFNIFDRFEKNLCVITLRSLGVAQTEIEIGPLLNTDEYRPPRECYDGVLEWCSAFVQELGQQASIHKVQHSMPRRKPGPTPGRLTNQQKNHVKDYLSAKQTCGTYQKEYCSQKGIEPSSLRRWEKTMRENGEL